MPLETHLSVGGNMSHLWPIAMLAFAAFMQWSGAGTVLVATCVFLSAFSWLMVLATDQMITEKALGNATVALIAVAQIEKDVTGAKVLQLVISEDE